MLQSLFPKIVMYDVFYTIPGLMMEMDIYMETIIVIK